MRLRDLERLLAGVPPHPKPRAELEQYATPADLAAMLLFEMHALGDLADRRVVDLGCGTGVFALGAALLGASEVVGVDVDDAALAVACAQAEHLGVSARIAWVASDVAEWSGAADTVVMNPPFGSQKRGADRPFLEKAFAAAPVVVSIHHAPTRAFVERTAAEAGFQVTHRWRLVFPLRHQFAHQEKAVHEVETIAFRLKRN